MKTAKEIIEDLKDAGFDSQHIEDVELDERLADHAAQELHAEGVEWEKKSNLLRDEMGKAGLIR